MMWSSGWDDGILYYMNALKVEMYIQFNSTNNDKKTYVIDQIPNSKGHGVSRLPP